MNPDISPRALFYLEHHEQIEEWHKLGSEARAATAEILRTFTEEFAEIADTRGLSVPLHTVGKYECVFLAAPDLPITNDGVPVLAVCFAWNPSWVLLDSETYGPFVAVRVAKGQYDGWVEVRERFLAPVRAERERLRLRHEPEWPVWKRVAAAPKWWADLDSYMATARSAVTEFLDAFEQPIRAALS